MGEGCYFSYRQGLHLVQKAGEQLAGAEVDKAKVLQLLETLLGPTGDHRRQLRVLGNGSIGKENVSRASGESS